MTAFPVFPNRPVGGLDTTNLMAPPQLQRAFMRDVAGLTLPPGLPDITVSALRMLRQGPDELSVNFFSPSNMSRLQVWIRSAVYAKTNQQAAIDDQPIEALLAVMVSIYARDARNIAGNASARMDVLNNMVIYDATNTILVNLNAYLNSIVQRSSVLQNMPSLPKSTTSLNVSGPRGN